MNVEIIYTRSSLFSTIKSIEILLSNYTNSYHLINLERDKEILNNTEQFTTSIEKADILILVTRSHGPYYDSFIEELFQSSGDWRPYKSKTVCFSFEMGGGVIDEGLKKLDISFYARQVYTFKGTINSIEDPDLKKGIEDIINQGKYFKN